jgi:transposase
MSVPHGHWKTTTFIAGLRNSGIVAPFVIDRPVNRTIFETWVQRVLVPNLRQGDIVIMDNLSSHKGPRVQALIEGRRDVAIPPALQSRLQPDRESLCQT